MKTALRTLAILYAAIILIAAGWALWTDIALLDSPHEHLLPDMSVAFLSFPASLSLSWLHEAFPCLFSRPFAQLAWLALCGLFQAAMLYLMSKFISARRSQAKV